MPKVTDFSSATFSEYSSDSSSDDDTTGNQEDSSNEWKPFSPMKTFKKRESQQKRKRDESEEQKKLQQERQREYRHKYWAKLTAEQVQERREKAREYHKQRRLNETPEERRRRLEKNKLYVRQWNEKWTREQLRTIRRNYQERFKRQGIEQQDKTRGNKSKRPFFYQKVLAITEEERESRLKALRESLAKLKEEKNNTDSEENCESGEQSETAGDESASSEQLAEQCNSGSTTSGLNRFDCIDKLKLRAVVLLERIVVPEMNSKLVIKEEEIADEDSSDIANIIECTEPAQSEGSNVRQVDPVEMDVSKKWNLRSLEVRLHRINVAKCVQEMKWKGR